MAHSTALPKSSDLQAYFNLQPCTSCDVNCKGDHMSFHCPICPPSKFKPTRKPKVLDHLNAHFFGPRGNVQVEGFRVTICPQNCGNYKTASSRGHFHCPHCDKTFTKKPPLIQHVLKCRGSLDKVLDGFDMRQTVTTEDMANDEHRVLETEPENIIIPPKPADGTAHMLPEKKGAEKSNQSVECGHCGKKYHPKYIRAHIRDQHFGNEPEIHQGRNHHSILVDTELGIYTCSKTLRGVQHPIHVVKKNMGGNAAVECEVSECRDICQTEWRSGNAGFMCDHLKSTEFAGKGLDIELNTDKLKDMLNSSFISTFRYQSCVKILDKATADERPVIVKIPNLTHGSQRYTFFSVYTGEVRWWCRLKRTVVTLDSQTSSLVCRCKYKSCEHKGLVRWYMFQEGMPVATGKTNDVDLECMEDFEEGDMPPSDSHCGDLSNHVEYLMDNKIIPEGMNLPNFSNESCPRQFIPSEIECFKCQVPLSAPQLCSRRAKVVALNQAPVEGFETFHKVCSSCKSVFRYQEVKDGVFNYDDSFFVTYDVLLHFRAALMNHTAINRVVSMLEYRLQVTINHSHLENAYLAFEALCGHSYDYFCVRCGHHPKILVHDLTKKAVFKFPVDQLKPPKKPTPQVDSESFWRSVRKEILARCFLKGQPNPFKMKPDYQNWAPYIGPHTRSSDMLYNTEYEKLHTVQPEDHEPVPEEVLTHLLADEKLDTVKRFCRVLGVSCKGSKLDMLCRLKSQSVEKANFDHAYSTLFGHSGGWLSSTCPHNVTYAVKFLLRSESPRDYVDVLRSMKYVPTVNIADIANGIASMANKIVPNFFHPHEGRLVETNEENVSAAKAGKLSVSLPYMNDDRPKSTDGHPITGSKDRYMLFDWFHQDNCKKEAEVLRRMTLVKELAGYVNSQAAEQLHRDKARDVYWLNEMAPSNHIFSFRLVTHLKNALINDKTTVRQQKVIPNLILGELGQLVRQDTDVPNQQVKEISTKSVSVFPIMPPTSVNLRDSHSYQIRGNTYRRRRVVGDGNCLFRSVCIVVPGQQEENHLNLRKECLNWCQVNRYILDIADQELLDIQTPGTAVGEVALTALANVLEVGILVVYQTKTSQEEQLFQPRNSISVKIFPILFDFSGHYDALLTDVAPPRTSKSKVAEKCLSLKRKASLDGVSEKPSKQHRGIPRPFNDLSLLERQRKILNWLVDSEEVLKAMGGELLDEDVMETRPECLCVNLLDEAVDLEDVRSLLTKEAWISLQSTLSVKRLTATWTCPVCNLCIEEGVTSISCDACLQWLHLKCAGLVRIPRKQKWFCHVCK